MSNSSGSIGVFYSYKGHGKTIESTEVWELVDLAKKELIRDKESSFISACVIAYGIIPENHKLKNIKVNDKYVFQSKGVIDIEDVYRWLNLIEISFSKPNEIKKECDNFNMPIGKKICVNPAACYDKLLEIDKWLKLEEDEEINENTEKEKFTVKVEKITENEDENVNENAKSKEKEAVTDTDNEKVKDEAENEIDKIDAEAIKDGTDVTNDGIAADDNTADENGEEESEDENFQETEDDFDEDDEEDIYDELEEEFDDDDEDIDEDIDEESDEETNEETQEETDEIDNGQTNQIKNGEDVDAKIKKLLAEAESEKERIIAEAIIEANKIKKTAELEANNKINDAQTKADSIIENAVKESSRKKEDTEKSINRLKEDAQKDANAAISAGKKEAEAKIKKAEVEAKSIKEKAIVDGNAYKGLRKRQLDDFKEFIAVAKRDTSKKAIELRDESKIEIFNTRSEIENVKKELSKAQMEFTRLQEELNEISENIKSYVYGATDKINKVSNKIEFKDAEKATDLMLLIYDQVFAMRSAYQYYFTDQETIHKDDVLDRLAVIEEVIEECLEEYGLSAFTTEKGAVIDPSRHDVESSNGGQISRTSIIAETVKKGFEWNDKNGQPKVKEKVIVENKSSETK